jgi:hypothetical protein
MIVSALLDALSFSLCFDTASWHIAMPSGESGIHPISTDKLLICIITIPAPRASPLLIRLVGRLF